MTSPKDSSPPKPAQEDPKSDKKDLPTEETSSSKEMAKEMPFPFELYDHLHDGRFGKLK